MDPLAGSPWSAPGTVSGFAQSLPNPVLMRFAETEWRRGALARVLDLGCGAGRNAIPLARLGWRVLGIDLSWPMLCAAAQRARDGRERAPCIVVHRRPALLELGADRSVEEYDLPRREPLSNCRHAHLDLRPSASSRPFPHFRNGLAQCSEHGFGFA